MDTSNVTPEHKKSSNIRLKLQVLMSVMHQKDHSILNKANIQTDAIVINQCARFDLQKLKHKSKTVLFYSLPERGVGLSRNSALMRCTADIAIFADEDMYYVNNYQEIITEAFENQPEADIILFNVPSKNPDRQNYVIQKNHRVRRFNCLRYGAPNIAVKISSAKNANLTFSLLFGGGSKYSAGEDSLFLYQAIKSGLRVHTYTRTIGYVTQKDSTWFTGYTNKFFRDKGAFFYSLSPAFAHLLGLQYVLRKHNQFGHEKTMSQALKLINEGVRNF